MTHGDGELPFQDRPQQDGPQVIIRKGRTEDEPFIREFTRNTFDWGDYVGDAFSEWLDEPGEVLVAEFQGRPVGVTHVSYLSPSEAWFEGIRVHPAFRRKGIGLLLSRTSIEAARQHGCRIARCAIDSENRASSELAKRLGFHLVGKLKELVRSFTWDSLVASLAKQTAAEGIRFKQAGENEIRRAALMYRAVGEAEEAHAESGARRRSAFNVRKAEEEDFGPIWSKASGEINYIGSDFRWRSLSPENIRRAISSGNLVVAVDERGMVEGGASFSEVWEDHKDSRLSGLYIETSSVFGLKAGIQAIVQHALMLLRKKALNLPDPTVAKEHSCQYKTMRECPSGQAVVPGSVVQGHGVALRDLTFKIYSLCEITSPAQAILWDLGFRDEVPDYLRPAEAGAPVTDSDSGTPVLRSPEMSESPGPKEEEKPDRPRGDLMGVEGVLDYHVGLWEMEL